MRNFDIVQILAGAGKAAGRRSVGSWSAWRRLRSARRWGYPIVPCGINSSRCVLQDIDCR